MRNNKEFPLEVGLNPFTFDGKKYIMALVIDITARKENEKQKEFLNSQLEKKIKERTSQLNKTIIQLKEVNLNFEKEIIKRGRVEPKLKKK